MGREGGGEGVHLYQNVKLSRKLRSEGGMR